MTKVSARFELAKKHLCRVYILNSYTADSTANTAHKNPVFRNIAAVSAS